MLNQSIYTAMKQGLAEYVGQPWQDIKNKFVVMGSDGASVMTGSKNGLIALMRKEVLVHCYAHRYNIVHTFSQTIIQKYYYFFFLEPSHKNVEQYINVKYKTTLYNINIIKYTYYTILTWYIMQL